MGGILSFVGWKRRDGESEKLQGDVLSSAQVARAVSVCARERSRSGPRSPSLLVSTLSDTHTPGVSSHTLLTFPLVAVSVLIVFCPRLCVCFSADHPRVVRPTDESKTSLKFCPDKQFNGDPFLQYGSCCTDIEEVAVEAKYDEAGPLTGKCADLHKQVIIAPFRAEHTRALYPGGGGAFVDTATSRSDVDARERKERKIAL